MAESIVVVREATRRDIRVMLQLIQTAFEEYRGLLDPPSGAHSDTEGMLSLLLQVEHALIAEVDGQPAGCVFYHISDRSLYMHRLSVPPPWRRQGVGARLVAAVEQVARDLLMDWVTLGVRISLPANRRYYEKLGYQVYDFASHPGYKTITFARMRKWVGEPTALRVEVVAYHSTWPEMYRLAAAELVRVYGDALCSIHHIGSTSVPGLAAKPIIDIMPLVHELEQVDSFDPLMLAIGYEPLGEHGIARRRFFRRRRGAVRTQHVHIFQVNDPEVARHLAFPAYLRAHPADADAYAQIKIEMAQRFPFDIYSYMAGKNALVKSLEAKALAWWSTKPLTGDG
jgi:GrpB-like predicted nucleotidyltransferase (UPF0157 family)/N-acetylglutamate synthase-like GNAT family acetyltransferase